MTSLFQACPAPLFFERDEESGVFRIVSLHEELSPQAPSIGHLLQHRPAQHWELEWMDKLIVKAAEGDHEHKKSWKKPPMKVLSLFLSLAQYKLPSKLQGRFRELIP